MYAKYLFYITLLGAYFIKVPNIYNIIRQLLIIELIVQLCEGMFYAWLFYNFTKVLNVTPKRYIDWAITTPSMLITLMIYLIYLKRRIENTTHELNLFTVVKDNLTIFIPVLVLNWLMLLFGYLAEMGIIPLFMGVFLGFIPFVIYYYIIYVNYVTNQISGHLLFWYFLFFWSLYGVAAVLPYYVKNACYNILDLFSKNFFGIFLSYLIFSGNY
jgi:hypothetical protein